MRTRERGRMMISPNLKKSKLLAFLIASLALLFLPLFVSAQSETNEEFVDRLLVEKFIQEIDVEKYTLVMDQNNWFGIPLREKKIFARRVSKYLAELNGVDIRFMKLYDPVWKYIYLKYSNGKFRTFYKFR